MIKIKDFSTLTWYNQLELFNKILVVCVGNICRSPMAEALLQNAFIQSGKTEQSVSSAGLGALAGYQADPIARQLIAEKGLDISAHRARQLTDEMLHQADLILVMETWQKVTIEKCSPSARGKIFRLGKWDKIDINDPYQKNLSEFIKALKLIEQGVAQWMAKL